MTLPKYQIQQLKTSDYEGYLTFLEVAYACKFFSLGRHGDFQLRVFITRPKDYAEECYNLGFGVWDSENMLLMISPNSKMVIFNIFSQQ